MLESPTKRQHFVSQTEQRFNASDSQKSRIYQFEVIDHEKGVIKLTSPKGVAIRKNLAIEDLFAFEKEGKLRRNFERLFEKYEQRISQAVKALEVALSKADGQALRNLIPEIWLLKFLNIWRNPYGVKKALNTFPMLTEFVPTDPYFREQYEKIDQLTEPPFEGFDRLGLTLEEYKRWLKVLLLLLMPSKGWQAQSGGRASNMFEQLALRLLTDSDRYRVVMFHVLSEEFPGRFLLNDRSYFYSTESDDPHKLALHFNVTDQITMEFLLVDPSEILAGVEEKHPQARYFPQEVIRGVQAELASTLQVLFLKDCKSRVEWFNQRMVLQAKQHLFCSRKEVIGVTTH